MWLQEFWRYAGIPSSTYFVSFLLLAPHWCLSIFYIIFRINAFFYFPSHSSIYSPCSKVKTRLCFFSGKSYLGWLWVANKLQQGIKNVISKMRSTDFAPVLIFYSSSNCGYIQVQGQEKLARKWGKKWLCRLLFFDNLKIARSSWTEK